MQVFDSLPPVRAGWDAYGPLLGQHTVFHITDDQRIFDNRLPKPYIVRSAVPLIGADCYLSRLDRRRNHGLASRAGSPKCPVCSGRRYSRIAILLDLCYHRSRDCSFHYRKDPQGCFWTRRCYNTMRQCKLLLRILVVIADYVPQIVYIGSTVSWQHAVDGGLGEHFSGIEPQNAAKYFKVLTSSNVVH
jgi:hypothetical protein